MDINNERAFREGLSLTRTTTHGENGVARRALGVLMVSVVLIGAGGAAARDQARMMNAGSHWYDGGAGGAFNAVRASGYIGQTGGPGGTGTSFLTFCIEYSEHFSFGSTYYTQIATSAASGGVAGQVGGVDPISARTAALYREFRRGSSSAFGGLVNLTQAGSLGTAMHALQDAIWYEEQEIPSLPSGLATSLWNWANTHQQGLGNVRVLRLYTSPDLQRGNSQDQLTLIPLPPAAWAGMSSLALLATGFSIRRRRLHGLGA